MEFYKEVERNIIKKYRKELYRPFVKALDKYELIKENDKIAVCISGGKDSFLMAKLFQEIMNHGNVKFECRFICMDPGYKEENRKLIEENAKKLNIPVVGIVDTNCNPQDLDYPIPGNDDAIRSVSLIADVMANAIIEGKQGESFETTEEQNVEEEATSMEQVASEADEKAE